MTNAIGNIEIGTEALALMRERGGKWAAYQNHAMDSCDLGHLRFLRVGPGCTFETAPDRMPDTRQGLGWKYLHVGYVNLVSGEIENKQS